MDFIDFHCHLEHEFFTGKLDGVVKRACGVGVTKIVTAGSGPQANRAQLEIASRFPGVVYPVLGVSPYDVFNCDWKSELSFIRKNAGSIVGIGEIGIDLHHFSLDSLGLQKEAFIAQVELAEELGLPIVVHSRKAEEVVIDILDGFPQVKALMHFFLLEKLASKAAANGRLVSLPSIKSSSRLKIARQLDLSSIACETDSPFGLGVGQQSEPKDVVLAYGVVCEAAGKSMESVAERIYDNSVRLFGWE